MQRKQFNARFQNKKVTVIGIGISNRPLIEMLASAGAIVTACDKKDRSALGKTAEELEMLGVTLSLGAGYLDRIDADIVFRTPGMRYDHPKLQDALLDGAELTSEMQVFFELCPAHMIGITGSDGKTTTTTLIYNLLKNAGKRVYLGGNIGSPLLPRLFEMTPDDYCVVELSSFQLHTMTRSPEIAVITNLSPNHLDYHTDEYEYVDAKMNIFLYQKENARLCTNGQVKTHLDQYLLDEIRERSAHRELLCGERLSFNGTDVYEKDGIIYCSGEAVMKCSDIRIPGRHNVENYMAAIAATKGLVPFSVVKELARSFGGVEHRIEFVREVKGVKFYNSSIDSSPTRTMAALAAFGDKKLTVLLGGYDKHLDYTPLAEPLCRSAKAVYLSGATAEKIRAAIVASPAYREGVPIIVMTDNYRESVEKIYAASSEGDIVLLSPASASFDAFKNFEERGRFFKELVHALKE